MNKSIFFVVFVGLMLFTVCTGCAKQEKLTFHEKEYYMAEEVQFHYENVEEFYEMLLKEALIAPGVKVQLDLNTATWPKHGLEDLQKLIHDRGVMTYELDIKNGFMYVWLA